MGLSTGALELKTSAKVPLVDIMLMIGIASEAHTGLVALCFPEKTICATVSRMLGENFSQISPDVMDASKEILNILFNLVKKPLGEKGIVAFRSIPAVVRGQNMELCYLSRTNTVIVPFESKLGALFCEITLHTATVSERF